MERLFELDGYVIATSWLGCTGYVRLLIKTNEKGLKKIEANPLQDYIKFGVQSVDYAFFEVYLIEVERAEKYTRKTHWHEPVKTIEAGDVSYIEKMGDDFLERVWLYEEPVLINY